MQKDPITRIFVIGAAIICVATVIVAFLCQPSSGNSQASQEIKKDPAAESAKAWLAQYEAEGQQTRKLVAAWLEDQKKGSNGYRHWGRDIDGDNPEKVSFYSVRNYEIVSCSSGLATIRVDSSNAAGMQITRTWLVFTSASWPDDNQYRDPEHIAWVREPF
jgi:uncharacterized protein (DUF3084 family)